MFRKYSKILVLCIMAMLVMTPVNVSAIDKIDLDRQVSLTITADDSAMAGMEVEIYKVADTNEWAEFTLSGDFAGYNVEVNGLDSEGWKNLALTLSGYADRDGIKPLASAKLDSAGKAVFSQLEPGLYLVDSTEYTSGDNIYSPAPFMICLPNRAADSETWDYNVSTALKYEVRPVEKEKTDISVHKVWIDEGHENMRPESIEVQLLKDGEVIDTVTLSESNNWNHVWEGLDSAHEYKVTESYIEIYIVSVSKEDNCYVITNSFPTSGEEADEGGDDPYDEEGDGPGGNEDEDGDGDKDKEKHL